MENKHDKATENQTLKDKLMAIILLETAKDYKKMDSDLVTECVDFLMELERKERLTKEEIEQRVNEIPFKGKVTALNSYAKKKLRAKRIAVIAAVLAILIALFGIFAISSGDTVTEFFRQMTYSVFKNLDEDSINEENITFFKSNETKMYSSIRDFAESEDVEILYPGWLPDNEKIIKIRCLSEEKPETYLLQSDMPKHSITVEVNSELSEDYKMNCIQKEISDYLVYYEKTPKFVQATFVYENNRYVIISDTEDNLFKIIENMKEIN